MAIQKMSLYLEQVFIPVWRDHSEDILLFYVVTSDLDNRASYWDRLDDVIVATTWFLVAKESVTFQYSVHGFPRASVRFLNIHH